MEKLNSLEIKKVQGGIIQAFVAGMAIGVAAKKGWNKYQNWRNRKQKSLDECAKSPNCA